LRSEDAGQADQYGQRGGANDPGEHGGSPLLRHVSARI
jgi:hypothetical protein